MARKTRPFTRKQRSNMLKKKLREEREERQAARAEARDFRRYISVFRGCDLERYNG